MVAVVVDLDGVRQAVLRGDGAPIHSMDNAYYKAYTIASLGLVAQGRDHQADRRPHGEGRADHGAADAAAERDLRAGRASPSWRAATPSAGWA